MPLLNKFSIPNYQSPKPKGLTLLELLITIAILGMMVAVIFAIVNPLEQNRKANDSLIRNTAQEFLQASYRYNTDNDVFPWNQTSCINGGTTGTPTPGGGSGVTSGLISYWRLDETSGGNAIDGVGANNGIAAAGSSPDNITYKLGGASRNFNGNTTAYISLGNTSSTLNIATILSINLWVKHTAANPVSKDYLCAGTNGFCLFWNSSGQLSFGKNGVAYATATSLTIPDVNWHMITVTFDGSNVRFYKDGSLETSSPHALAQTFATGLQYYLGWDGLSAFQMVGNIDNVGVWSRALSAADVTSIYSTENGGVSIIGGGLGPTPTPLPNGGVSSITTPASLSSLNSCVSVLSSGGYAKDSMNSLSSNVLNNIYVNQPNPLLTPADPQTLSVCFLPKSRSSQQDPQSKYVQNGNLAPYSSTSVIAGYDQNGNAVSTGTCISAGGNNYCYMCVY